MTPGNGGTKPIPDILPGYAEVMSMRHDMYKPLATYDANANTEGVVCWNIHGSSKYTNLYIMWSFPFCTYYKTIDDWNEFLKACKNWLSCVRGQTPCNYENTLAIMLTDRDYQCDWHLAYDMWWGGDTYTQIHKHKNKISKKEFPRMKYPPPLTFNDDELVITARMNGCRRRCVITVTIEECPFTHCPFTQ